MMKDEDQDSQSQSRSPRAGERASRGRDQSQGTPRKVTFDDFQIQKTAQQQQIDDEKRAIAERDKRVEEQKPGFLKFAVPRLRSIGENMMGGTRKLFTGKGHPNEDDNDDRATIRQVQSAYEEERLHVRVARTNESDQLGESTRSSRKRNPGSETKPIMHDLFASSLSSPTSGHERNSSFTEKLERPEDEFTYEVESERVEDNVDDTIVTEEDEALESELLTELEAEIESEQEAEIEAELIEAAYEEEVQKELIEEEFIAPAAPVPIPNAEQNRASIATHLQAVAEDTASQIFDTPQIDAALNVYLDQLREFDTFPKRASEPRDPRTDFVQLLSEQLDILREQLSAMSALFFWVNSKKQQLVLESGSLEDRAHMYLSAEKRFPIELDAISMVVTRKKPELHSSISALAELDLIPYYSEAIGVRSFAAMPVLFGDGLVAVITVDSPEEEQFSQETLRILTAHSKLISGLIKSYIEKYDLLAAARTLESARKLYQIVSPEGSMRAMRDVRKGPEWVLRALTEAIAEIIDWEWLATASFDDARRIWSITSLQSKLSRSYIPPQTQIVLSDSIVGKCLQSGRSVRYDHLTAQQIRYSFEEDRGAAVGHSFITIPIRTASKNYGALAIEHSERARYTDADVETLEHLARSAASALEITALSEIVEERALTDLLTGVLNKRGFLQRINEELARAMEFDEPLTLLLFEIDSATEFFSRFSQEDADTIVLAVTRLLRYGGRPFDVIARVGEHAFAAILIKMSDEEGYLWSEKMRKMIVSEVIAIGKRRGFRRPPRCND
jgi:diguanylate cyclase (GGDEF)-like protein